jgi:hypothetical protein
MITTWSRFRAAFAVFVASVVACLCAAPRIASAAVWSLQQELIARDGEPTDQFGFSVAASGNTALIGTPTRTVGVNASQGAAYVWTFNGTRWLQQAELTGGDGAAGDDFGTSVAISGNTAIVGAVGKAFGGQLDQGAAYIYAFNGSSWVQQAELAANDGATNDSFGASVAIAGNTVFIGAPNKAIGANSSQGVVYVFSFNGSSWLQQAELTPNTGATNDSFGRSVAASGNTVIVGASTETVSGRPIQGAVYVFAFNGTSWVRQGQFIAIDGEADDKFGFAVSISGNTAIVGASGKTEGANAGQGAAYVFAFDGTSWGQVAEITASDGATLDLFGSSVAIADNTAIVGAPSKLVGNQATGGAYVFTVNGTSWQQQAELTAFDGQANDGFGGAVAITDNNAVVGAYGRIVGANASQGVVYAFVPGAAVFVPALPAPAALALLALLGLAGLGAASLRGRGLPHS